MWQLKELQFSTPGSLVDLQGAKVLEGQVSHSNAQPLSGRAASIWRIHARISVEHNPELSLALTNKQTFHQLTKGFGLTKLICHCGDMVYSSPFHSHPPNTDLCFQFSLPWHHGVRGYERDNSPCLLHVSRSKVDHEYIYRHRWQHWGSLSESFQCSCKAVTIGNKMWFLFSCDWEAGSYAQWCVVLINLQHLNFSQPHGGSSTRPVILMWMWAVSGCSTWAEGLHVGSPLSSMNATSGGGRGRESKWLDNIFRNQVMSH